MELSMTCQWTSRPRGFQDLFGACNGNLVLPRGWKTKATRISERGLSAREDASYSFPNDNKSILFEKDVIWIEELESMQLHRLCLSNLQKC